MVKVIWHKDASPPQTDGIGGVNVPSHEGTWAQPGEYNWTRASFGPPKSISQTASRLVQPFLHRWQHSVPIPYNGPPLPSKLPFPMGLWNPSNTWFLCPTPVLNPNGISIGWAVLQRSLPWQTDWQTTLSVTTGRIYVLVCSTAIRPNKRRHRMVWPYNIVSGPGQAIGPWCVCQRVRTITFERNDHWYRHLACWFILTQSRSNAKITVTDQILWSRDEKRC